MRIAKTNLFFNGAPMTQNQNNNAVGDTVAPAQRQNAESLRRAVDQGRHIQADAAPKPQQVNNVVSFAGARWQADACAFNNYVDEENRKT